ncbi:MAG: glycosyltransferase family 2 protein [Candidatus Methanomethyliaceae archaeon]
MEDSCVGNEAWPKVAIIILNWNGWRDTLECLKSIEKQKYPNYEVIVVDNGSVDDSVMHITKWIVKRPEYWGTVVNGPDTPAVCLLSGAHVVLRTENLTLIRSEENLGFAGGCNFAIDYTLAKDPSIEFVILLNNDARLEPNCLAECIEVAERERAGIVSPLIMDFSSQILAAGAGFPLEIFKAGRVRVPNSAADFWTADSVPGAAMVIRRDVLERRRSELGYFFDSSLFMYGEELELCVWAGMKGYSIIVAARAVARHKLTASSGGRGSVLAYYYTTRNRVYLARHLLPLWLRVLFHIWYLPSRLIRGLRKAIQGERELAIAILNGLFDGYRGVIGKWNRHPPA